MTQRQLSLRGIAAAGLAVAVIAAACQAPEPAPEPPTTTETQAVHDENLFEIDGNPQDAPGTPGDDWSTLGAPTAEGSGVSIFTTGGSKDINDISRWVVTNGSVPDKDDLLNAHAVTREATDGDLILYFGADRFATNGDAQIGFWFLQDDVSVSGSGFTGEHKEGDILVLSDFTNGGSIGTIQVCTWAGGDGTAGHLECQESSVVSAGNGVFCTPDDIACATINQGPVPSFWSYTPKSAAPNVYALGAFFEGGINATELLGDTPCFASFLVETRSSQSVSATLKDFVLGDLQVCAPSVELCKQCNVALQTVGDNVVLEVQYSGWACNTGNVDLTVDLVDDQDGDLLDDVVIPAETCVSFDGAYQPATSSETDPSLAEFTDTVTFTGTHPQLDDIVETVSATCGPCAASDPCPDPPFEAP